MIRAVSGRGGELPRAFGWFALSMIVCSALLASNRAYPTFLPRPDLGTVHLELETWSSQGAAAFASGVDTVRHVRDLYADNQSLRERNRLLEERIAQLQSVQAEDAALRRDLDFDRTFAHRLLTVAVVGRSPDSFDRSVIVDRGSDAGIHTGMVVITGAGVVGRVSGVATHSATVQTVLDPSSRINGYGSQSGLDGVVMGDGQQVAFETETRLGGGLANGEWVLTSGLGGTFPRGLVIGQVVAVHARSSATLQDAQLVPAVDVESVTAVQVVLDFPSS